MKQKHNIFNPSERKVKKKAKKKGIFKWTDWILVVLVTVLVVGMAILAIEKSIKYNTLHMNHELLKTNVTNEIEVYKGALKSAGWQIHELKQLIYKTNNFAMACLEKRNVYKYVAEDFKTWGKDMEKLAQIHAGTFQELRIERDELNGDNIELDLNNQKLMLQVKELKKQLEIKEGIIENQKEQIHEVAYMWEMYHWKFIEDMKLQKKLLKWLKRDKEKSE